MMTKYLPFSRHLKTHFFGPSSSRLTSSPT
jgi:hypothetical protein